MSVPRWAAPSAPAQLALFPELRYKGWKRRLLPWIHEILDGIDFEIALDPFSGSNATCLMR